MKRLKFLTLICMVVIAAGCSDGNTNSDNGNGGNDQGGCEGLCVDSGFTSGNEMDFGGGLIECFCDGTGGAISQEDCSAYCAEFGVSPENSILSQTNVPNDKCVCDGTAG